MCMYSYVYIVEFFSFNIQKSRASPNPISIRVVHRTFSEQI